MPVRLYLQILLLMPLLYSCRGGMSNRGGDFNIDRTGNNTPCSEQTSPSPQCPTVEEKEGGDENEEPDTPAGSGANDSVSVPAQLTTYKDGMWGEITLSPLTMKKNTEAQLKMTFTATKAIDRQINLTVDFPSPNTGFKLNDKIEVSPATAQDFFKLTPSVFTSSVTNKATAEMVKIAEGEHFTLTFTITPQQDFDFKAYTASSTRLFKNSRGKTPEITVYRGDTPPAVTPDLSPLYTSAKLEMRLKPWPHRIKKDTATELTLTFTAIRDLEKKSIGANTGRRTHDVGIGISPCDAVSGGSDDCDPSNDRKNYKVKSLSPRKYFKGGRIPLCSIPRNCKLQIVEMKKGESFELKLTVNASKDFSIGWAGNASQLRKVPDGMHAELDDKPPQIEVK